MRKGTAGRIGREAAAPVALAAFVGLGGVAVSALAGRSGPEIACQILPAKSRVTPRVLAMGGATVDMAQLTFASEGAPREVTPNQPVQYPMQDSGGQPITLTVMGHVGGQHLEADCQGQTPPPSIIE